MSILLLVFLLQLFLHVINSVAAQTISELLWILYNKTPLSSNSNQYAAAAQLKRDVVRLKREMAAISAQDEFAKWAKLRRQHDKAAAEYEKASSSLQSSRGSFNASATAVKFVFSTLIRFGPQYYYSRTPTFWLPAGWVPGYVEWLLSFPRAPKGSVSIQVWGIACTAVIRMVGEAITAAYALAMSQRIEKAKEKGRRDVKAGGKKEL